MAYKSRGFLVFEEGGPDKIARNGFSTSLGRMPRNPIHKVGASTPSGQQD